MMQAQTGWMNNNILAHPEDLRNAVLIVHGEKAHSRYMGEDTFKKLKGENKQLIIVPGATHTDPTTRWTRFCLTVSRRSSISI